LLIAGIVNVLFVELTLESEDNKLLIHLHYLSVLFI